MRSFIEFRDEFEKMPVDMQMKVLNEAYQAYIKANRESVLNKLKQAKSNEDISHNKNPG